jgi:dihydrofolate reductase
MGIGRAGGLPWPRLRKEMAYFSRVTQRVPAGPEGASKRRNAVIMGTNTWRSIPAKFRPLPGRVNVVVSRTPGEFGKTVGEGTVVVGSIEEGLGVLGGEGDIGRVFVIGGAQLYRTALEAGAERVLFTKVRTEYECDVHFPVDLEGGEGGWKRKSVGELGEWVGEDLGTGVEKEGDVEYEFCMFERDVE